MPYKNKDGLVPIHKIVTENGKQIIRTYYVSIEEAKNAGYKHHLPKKEGKDALNNLLRDVRKYVGSKRYREIVKANGINWERSDHDGADTMRCSSALYQHLMLGGTLNIDVFETKAPLSSKEKGLNRLIQRLGLSYQEKEDGSYSVGEGYKVTMNKWGKEDTVPGSIRLVTVVKAPEDKEKYWGNGYFIQLDSSFADKNKIKNELDGKWDTEKRKWVIPFRQFVEALKTFHNVSIEPDLTETIKAVMKKIDVEKLDLIRKPPSSIYESVGVGLEANKEIDISDFQLAKGMRNISLFDHQKKGVRFLLENKRAVLGLAVGLGKTPTSIAAVKQLKNDKKIKRAIVVAPSSVKYNWKEEIEKFSDMRVAVLESSDLRGTKEANTWTRAKNADIIIVNYEMLRKPEVRTKLHKLAPDCIIADEAHKLKNSRAQQTVGFRRTWRDAEYKFFLSATPFPNGKPQETHTILSHLRPDKVGSWTTFGKLFVEWDNSSWGARAVALKNLDDLKNRMSDVVFMRNHNSEDVTTSLPKERHTTFNIEMTDAQKKMYKAIAEDIMGEIKFMESRGINASTPAMIAKLKRLEQVGIDPDMLVIDPKTVDMNKLYPKEEWAVQTTVDHLEDDSNRGMVIFCDMKLPLQKVRQGLINEGVDATKIAIVSGAVKPEERTAIQKRFNEGEIKVVLCTNAAEEGVNFQHGAHTLIHLDQVWVPKSISQREGRILRTGQPSPYTNFFSPIITGTVEDRKRAKLAGKVDAIENLLGNGAAGSVKNNINAEVNPSGVVTLDDVRDMIGAI